MARAKGTVEGKAKFVRAFNTQKGTAYSGIIQNSKMDEDTQTWYNSDIKFVYFGYDATIQDGDTINIKGTFDIDLYDKENPRLQLTGFELLPITSAKGGEKQIGDIDAHLDDVDMTDAPF